MLSGALPTLSVWPSIRIFEKFLFCSMKSLSAVSVGSLSGLMIALPVS